MRGLVMSEEKLVPVELVGGPHDGQVHYTGPGTITMMIPHGVQLFMYVKCVDGRFHFKPVTRAKPSGPN